MRRPPNRANLGRAASTAFRPTATLPFSFLRETAEEQLSALLGGERPQTIAVVLSSCRPIGPVPCWGDWPRCCKSRSSAAWQNSTAATRRHCGKSSRPSWPACRGSSPSSESAAAGPETIAKILAACDSRLAAEDLGQPCETRPAVGRATGSPAALLRTIIHRRPHGPPNCRRLLVMATIIRAADPSHDPHAVAFNFDDLTARAAEHVSQANAAAAKIVAEAQEQADAIRQQAAEEGRQAANPSGEANGGRTIGPRVVGPASGRRRSAIGQANVARPLGNERRTVGLRHRRQNRPRRAAAATGNHPGLGPRSAGIGRRQPERPACS